MAKEEEEKRGGKERRENKEGGREGEGGGARSVLHLVCLKWDQRLALELQF